MPREIIGPLTYLDVRGQDQATATANLEAAGILYQFADEVYSGQYAEGEVAFQSPDPDVTTEIDSTDVVTLTLSLGVSGSVLLTTFLDGETAVPSTATYVSGHAYAQDGSKYIAEWPSNDAVFYDGPFAYRADGAQIVATSGIRVARPQGVALTFRGEMLVATDNADLIHNGWPLLEDGMVCVSDVSSADVGGDAFAGAFGGGFGAAFG